MLASSSWQVPSEGLRVGSRVRIDHDCGPGRTLMLSRDSRGYRAHCFRCNDSGSAPGPQESLAEKAQRLRANLAGDAELSHTCELPVPQVRDPGLWPPKFAVWLYRAGLGRAEIGRLGAFYHPPSDRVVLPVFEGPTAVFWQARALDGRMPKYMAPALDRAQVLPRWGHAECPTITEDLLSAFKVGLVGEGWCAMGTRASNKMVAELLRRGTGVNVWLDPDPPGQRGAQKLCRQLRAYGLTVRNIVSDRDPKLMTRAQIKELLWLK